MDDDGIPNLRTPSTMHGPSFADDGAVPRRAQVIRLQFGGGKPARSRWQIGKAAITTARVGQGDDAARVEESVRRDQLIADTKFCGDLGTFQPREHEANKPGKLAHSALVEHLQSDHRYPIVQSAG